MPNALLQPDTSSYADPTGNALLARGYDPNAAMQSTLGTMQAAQGLQRSQVALSSEQIALGRQKLAAQNEVLGSFGPAPSLQNALDRITDAVKAGKIDPQTGSAATNQVIAIGDNPQGLAKFAFQHMAANASYDQQLQAMGMGAPQYVNTGKALQPVVPQSGLQPGFNPAGGGSLPLSTSPEFDNAPAKWLKPDGTLIQGTNAQYRQAVGASGGPPSSSAPSPFVGAANGQPAAPSPAAQPPVAGAPPAQAQGQPQTWTPNAQTIPLVTDDMFAAARARIQAGQGTAADRNVLRGYAVQHNMTLPSRGGAFEPQPGTPPTAAGQGGAPAAPAPAPGGGAMPPTEQPAAPAPVQAPGAPGAAPSLGLAGPKPGTEQAATVDADASAKQFATVTAQAANLPNLKATVSTMEAQLPQITTGPQAAAWNHVKSGANFVSELATGKDVFDPHAIAAQDEFHNQSVKLAQQQFQQLGGTGTDGQLASASGDVPNDSLSNLSNTQLLAMNKGLIDAQQARATAAQAWKERFGPASYSSFVDYWNKSFSPRAFQFNYLSPQERGVMLQSMSPQEKAQLKSAYDTAVANQWIAPQAGR